MSDKDKAIILSDIHLGHVFTPIKVLLNMDIRTKSTYREAMVGFDISMNQMLSDLGYDPYATRNTVQLYGQPTDVRLMGAQNRLAAFEANKEVGLCDFVQHARNVMYDFLQVIKLGHLHSLQMNSSGLFEIVISNTLHESGLEHNASTKAKFESQLNYLASLGLETAKEKGLNSYHFSDTDSNRSVIKKILIDRGAIMIRVNAWRDSIDQVSFNLDPKNLCNFVEKPTDFTLPVTDELNEDEMIKMKKLIREIPSSLAFIKTNPDMLQTCGFVSESSVAEMENIVGFEGEISKRVRERHSKERAANMNIRDIEKEIGEKFPAEIARDTMEKLAATLAYFCVENLHGIARNIKITEWGTVSMDVKICQRSDDLRYSYCFDDAKYNEPTIPDWDLMEDVFEVVKNRNGGIRLMDTENNRKTIANFVRSVCGFEIDSISIVRDDCYVTRTRHGQAETNLENIFVIDQISVSVDHIEGILRQHDLCKMVKKL